MPTFVKQTFLRASAEDVFSWHAGSGALERLTPPWEHVDVLERRGGLEDGSRATLRMYAGPLPLTWQAEHGKCVLGREFNDVQVSGPFARWEHQHRFIPCTGGCLLEDRINYELPLGFIGRWLGAGFVQRKLGRAFEYRHVVTRQDIEAHQNAQSLGKLKVLISGATGLIGSQLRSFLLAGGHEVRTLGRDARSNIQWDPERGELDASQLEGLDAVVHLAGENVAAGRWNGTRKRRILESRVLGTSRLAQALSKLKNPPRVFVCASAIGIYGHAGDQDLDETAAPGTGFLADVCRKWEKACEPAQSAKIRVVNLRVGVVLTPRGGALAKMLPAFRLGLGSNIGTGRQWISWISMDDLLRSIYHAITHDELRGPVNACAPNPVRQQDFARVLGKVLSRPTIRFLPSFLTSLPLRLVFGEMAQELLLEGSRVRPRTLLQSGFTFCHEQLEPALRHLLGRPSEVVRHVSDPVTTPPYARDFDTSTLPDGDYALTALAADAAGNVATSEPRKLTLTNHAPAPTIVAIKVNPPVLLIKPLGEAVVETIGVDNEDGRNPIRVAWRHVSGHKGVVDRNNKLTAPATEGPCVLEAFLPNTDIKAKLHVTVSKETAHGS